MTPAARAAAPHFSGQPPPTKSTTRPSGMKNVLGIWKTASISPPSGVQASWRLPGGR